MAELQMNPISHHGGSVVWTVPPQLGEARGRSGKHLWNIARDKVLTFKTRMNIQSGTFVYRKGRRMSNAVNDLREIIIDPNHRNIYRRLKYSCTPTGCIDQMLDEYASLIEKMVGKRRSRGHHAPWFTAIFVNISISIFFFMASEWAVIDAGLKWVPGPDNMLRYLEPMTDLTTFSSEFLNKWGARYLPNIVLGNQWWRWITSALVHASIRHCMGNMVSATCYGMLTESVHGALLTFTIWIVSSIGGNLWSGAIEDPCSVLVGASGGVFGIFGMFAADTIIRWEQLKRPIVRIMLITVVMLQFMYSIMNDPRVSHASHAGGLLCGIASSVIFLQDVKNKTMRRYLPVVSGFIMGITIIAMPWYSYSLASVLRDCPPL